MSWVLLALVLLLLLKVFPCEDHPIFVQGAYWLGQVSVVAFGVELEL